MVFVRSVYCFKWLNHRPISAGWPLDFRFFPFPSSHRAENSRLTFNYTKWNEANLCKFIISYGLLTASHQALQRKVQKIRFHFLLFSLAPLASHRHFRQSGLAPFVIYVANRVTAYFESILLANSELLAGSVLRIYWPASCTTSTSAELDLLFLPVYRL